MQHKVKQTKRLNEKISQVRQFQQERFESIQQINRERSIEGLKKSIQIEEERQRHQQALVRGKKGRELAVMLDSITIKRTKRADKQRKELEQLHLEEQRQLKQELNR